MARTTTTTTTIDPETGAVTTSETTKGVDWASIANIADSASEAYQAYTGTDTEKALDDAKRASDEANTKTRTYLLLGLAVLGVIVIARR